VEDVDEEEEERADGKLFIICVVLFLHLYALLAVVYVSHVEDRFFNIPSLKFV
jgi:hypothetical protein